MALERFDLSGRTALITGAAGLLGIEHASALLERGAVVVLTDISDAPLAAARATLAPLAVAARVVTHVMDVSQPEAIRAVADQLATEGRRVDILVNNAAIDPKVTGDRGVLETSRLEIFSL